MLDDVEDDAPYVEGQRDELVPVCAEHLVDYMTTHGGMSSHRCDEYGNDTRDPAREAKLKEEDRLAFAKAKARIEEEERLAIAKAKAIFEEGERSGIAKAKAMLGSFGHD
jgi:hypothetical protein